MAGEYRKLLHPWIPWLWKNMEAAVGETVLSRSHATPMINMHLAILYNRHPNGYTSPFLTWLYVGMKILIVVIICICCNEITVGEGDPQKFFTNQNFYVHVYGITVTLQLPCLSMCVCLFRIHSKMACSKTAYSNMATLDGDSMFHCWEKRIAYN